MWGLTVYLLKIPHLSGPAQLKGCSAHAVQRLTVITKSQSVIILGEGTVIIKGNEETFVVGGSIDIFIILIDAFTSVYKSQNLLIVYFKYEQFVVC